MSYALGATSFDLAVEARVREVEETIASYGDDVDDFSANDIAVSILFARTKVDLAAAAILDVMF